MTSMFPQVTIGYKATGAINNIVINSVVRKQFIGKWYLIPISHSVAIKTTTLEEGVKMQALIDFNEMAYKIINMSPFSAVAHIAILDNEQEDEAIRLSKFYGIGVPAKEELEFDKEGRVRIKLSEPPKEVKPPATKKSVRNPEIKDLAAINTEKALKQQTEGEGLDKIDFKKAEPLPHPGLRRYIKGK